MRIIKGEEEHVDACLSIAKALCQYFDEKAIATISEDLRKYLLYVTVDLDEVAGFATIQRKNTHVAELSWMAVRPERQRQGMGSALIEHIANDLRVRGIRLLEVKTLSEKVEYRPYERTRRFYE